MAPLLQWYSWRTSALKRDADGVYVVLVQVPYRLLKSFHKVQQRLVRELEKKFSGKDVVLIANRRILRAATSGKSNARPRSRTLTAVSLTAAR